VLVDVRVIQLETKTRRTSLDICMSPLAGRQGRSMGTLDVGGAWNMTWEHDAYKRRAHGPSGHRAHERPVAGCQWNILVEAERNGMESEYSGTMLELDMQCLVERMSIILDYIVYNISRL